MGSYSIKDFYSNIFLFHFFFSDFHSADEFDGDDDDDGWNSDEVCFFGISDANV